jgi:hypothetical protein
MFSNKPLGRTRPKYNNNNNNNNTGLIEISYEDGS